MFPCYGNNSSAEVIALLQMNNSLESCHLSILEVSFFFNLVCYGRLRLPCLKTEILYVGHRRSRIDIAVWIFTERTIPIESGITSITRARGHRFLDVLLSTTRTISSTLKLRFGHTRLKCVQVLLSPGPKYFNHILNSFPPLTKVEVSTLEITSRRHDYLRFHRQDMSWSKRTF